VFQPKPAAGDDPANAGVGGAPGLTKFNRQ